MDNWGCSPIHAFWNFIWRKNVLHGAGGSWVLPRMYHVITCSLYQPRSAACSTSDSRANVAATLAANLLCCRFGSLGVWGTTHSKIKSVCGSASEALRAALAYAGTVGKVSGMTQKYLARPPRSMTGAKEPKVQLPIFRRRSKFHSSCNGNFCWLCHTLFNPNPNVTKFFQWISAR